jgi:hypothetical protein
LSKWKITGSDVANHYEQVSASSSQFHGSDKLKRYVQSLTKKEHKDMTNFRKVSFFAGVLLLLVVLPLRAQLTNPMTFRTSFPFYVGNAKMPAGEYRVSQSGVLDNLILIESVSGSHSAFVEIDPTSADQPHSQSDVTFKKYGNVEFLNLVWVQGQSAGMQVEPSKYEQNIAKTQTPQKHSVSATNSKQSSYKTQGPEAL